MPVEQIRALYTSMGESLDQARRRLGRHILVRSFARIAETNLKKQGILPLTFANPADYDRFEQNDRVSVVGLAALAPGQPVTLPIKKADGRIDEIQARHTLTDEQIAWFRAGSALNAAQKRSN